jgi:exodeoxyribonuclease VIII
MITLEDLKERPLSYSSIKEFAKSPRHFLNYRNKPKKVSPELTYGSALHCMLLEPQEFNNEFVVIPKLDMRTKDGKETYAKLEAEAEGKTMINAELHDEIWSLAEYVKSNPEFEVIMEGAKTEVKDEVEIYGLPFVRIRDIVKGDATIDIKTVQNGQLDNLTKDFFNYQYHIQSAVYGGQFAFYVIEKGEPFYNGLIQVSDDFIKYGKKELERLCFSFNYCLEHPECFNQSYEFHYMMEGRKPIVSLPTWVKYKD